MTSNDSAGIESAALRGVFAPGDTWEGSRLAPETIVHVPGDTAAAARVPAAVRLELTGDAEELELELTVGDRMNAGSPTLPLQISVWVDDEAVALVPVTPSTTSVRLPSRASESSRITIYLPEGDDLRVTALRAVNGTLQAAPRGPRWVVYGDSITQGWSTTDAGMTWAARVARARGLDLVNLGFAGAARGELPVAFQLADSAPELVTLAWGTNSWSTIPTDGPSIAHAMRLFLAAIRAEDPAVPVLVLSPIVRPEAEDRRNVFGATLHDLRASIEATVLESAQDDVRLALLGGLDLVPDEELVDGVHPGDVGHARIAARVMAELDRLLSRPS
ncbi:SGNH/GDSL hydrolase family protein [soil metagenome]